MREQLQEHGEVAPVETDLPPLRRGIPAQAQACNLLLPPVRREGQLSGREDLPALAKGLIHRTFSLLPQMLP